MKLKLLFISSLCVITLSACRNPATPAAKTATSPAVETSAEVSLPVSTETAITSQAATESVSADTSAEENSKDISQTVDFKTLLGLIGKTDSEVVSVLGEGKSTANNSSSLINRVYTLSLFDEDVSASLYFNLYHEGTGQLEHCIISLNKPDLEGYEKILEDLLGKPSKTYEKSYFFTTDTATVVLADPYDDVPYIEITSNSID